MDRFRANLHWEASATRGRSTASELEHMVYFPGRGDEKGVCVSPSMQHQGCAKPMELLLAAVSSSMMISFIELCVSQSIVVFDYQDQAELLMRTDERGEAQLDFIRLKPVVRFSTPHSDRLQTFAIRFLGEAQVHSLLIRTLSVPIKLQPHFEFGVQ
ncbi:MAG: hypothetical protein KDK39_03325 [Leptospiraceae bacterium]|nr:hypothetical protein [Leptospiraceae bacterium]